jgi:hypothetical protein
LPIYMNDRILGHYDVYEFPQKHRVHNLRVHI